MIELYEKIFPLATASKRSVNGPLMGSPENPAKKE